MSDKSKPDRVLLEREQRIYDFLKSCPVGVLSLVTPDNEPHGSVIYFVTNKDFTISFVTKSETRKYENISRNNHVSLTVFDAATQTTAQVVGKAKEIIDSDEINQVAGTILKASMKTSDENIPPITKLIAGEFVAFKIIPDQIRMAVFSRPDAGDYSEIFETVESFELRSS